MEGHGVTALSRDLVRRTSGRHDPRHVHVYVAGAQLVIELTFDGRVMLRPGKAIRNASRADVRKVLNVAAAHFDDLVQLWEYAHEEN